MTRKLSALLTLFLTFSFLSGVSGAQAAPAKIDTRYVEGTDKQAFIFNPLVVNKVELNMTEADLQALRDAPTEYHAATLKMTTPKGVSAVYRVGVRLKGGWGSYVNLDNKAGFKIKMNFSVKGQKFYGVKKFTLNNMIQDSSMLHEATSYRLFRAMGVPAPRVGYANVLLNGVDYGLHSNIETYDDELFDRWKTGKTAHLYEGGYGTEVGPDMEVDDGNEADRSDVTEVRDINNNLAGADWFNAVRNKVDIQQMIMNWAVEHYIGHWDGYTRGWPNNYYLHRTKGGLFTMHPWGTDQTFVFWNKPDLIDDGATMMTRCIQYQPCNELYRAALTKIEQKIPSLDLPGMVDRIWAKIQPHNEADPRKPYSTESSIAAVAETKDFMNVRFAELVALNASRKLASVGFKYSLSAPAVDKVIRPTVTKKSDGLVSFSRLIGDGVCNVDVATGAITLLRKGVCKVGVHTSQTSVYQAAMAMVTLNVPALPTRITVSFQNTQIKNQSQTLSVVADSVQTATAKLVSGSCKVTGLSVKALASSGTCKVRVSVASDGIYAASSKVISITLQRP
jgi:hypothetical protein